MAKKQFRFEKFTDSTTAATREQWLAEAADGMAFVSEIERFFDWVQTHQEVSENDAVAFGVFDRSSKVALGICEVIVQRKTMRSKWVKMLRLHLRPSLDAKLQAGDPEEAMEVFVESMSGSLGLQLTHQANTLKVYGRTNEQLTFLRMLVKQLQIAIAGKPVKVAIEGRFLTIVIS